MCGLFGMVSYGDVLDSNQSNNIIAALGLASSQRGTDATGISYIANKKVHIHKAAKAALNFDFKIQQNVVAVMGHTRMTTQGSELKNHNNHPFLGRCAQTTFALAHNGVIHNEEELRYKYKLSKPKIETDSYVAVQLLEAQEELSISSIQNLAESVEGSYCFTILDCKDNLYIVKGNNPIALIHNKDLKAFFYASTEQILWQGIVASNLFSKFKATLTKNPWAIEEILLNNGDIIKIHCSGKMDSAKIQPSRVYDCGAFNRYHYLDCYTNDSDAEFDDYMTQLRYTAMCMGIDGLEIDYLVAEDYSLEEIEDYINMYKN